MREISRRIKILEKRIGSPKLNIYTFGLIGTTKQEVDEKIKEIERTKPNAVYIIDAWAEKD